MKKSLKFLTVAVALVLFLVSLTACSGGKLELDNPKNVKYDGTAITWDAVEGASEYTVRINDGEEYTVSGPRYSYSATGSEFTVSITAVSSAKKIVKSGQTNKTFLPLPNISELRISNDGEVSWDVVTDATAYEVMLDGDKSTVTTVSAASYTGLPSGTHSVQVRPIVEGNSDYYSKWSAAKSITVLGSLSLDDITYENGKIRWKVVSGAKCYEVSINGVVASDSVASTEFVYDSENVDFEVSIKAIGNGSSSVNGAPSPSKTFTYLPTVTNIRVEDGILVWDEISKADGYKVKLNGTEFTVTECAYDNLKSGIDTAVQVMPTCEDTTYFSDWSAETIVHILAAPIVHWNSDYELDGEANSNLYWDTVAGAAGYSVKLTAPDGTSEIKSFGETQRFFQEVYPLVGQYIVEVKATAPIDESNRYDSAYSLPVTVERLAAPTRVDSNFIVSNPADIDDGFTVTFGKVSGAIGYELYQDNRLAQNGTSNQFVVKNLIENGVVEEQTFNYKIRSIGNVDNVNGKIYVKLSSLSSESLAFEISVLAMPTNTDISGYEFTYGAVDRANGYVIDVGGQGFTSATTSYDMQLLEAGNYAVRVCAKGNGSNVLASNYTAPINVYRLTPPTNVRIDTSDASEGVLSYDTVMYATGYSIIFDNSDNATPVTTMMNINNYITEQGTTVSMQSVANYFNDNKTIYYMTSKRGPSTQFVKLAAPTFGEVAFTNTQLVWKTPDNMNTQYYTPTYEVYYENGVRYNGEKNGTTMDISYLEGGESYTFYVKAIGNGTSYINSAKSTPVTIYKLASAEVNRENGAYTWKAVTRGVNYVVYVDGVRKAEYTHESGKTYSYVPDFSQLKDYKVEVIAIGDGGYTTIDSKPTEIIQKIQQLTTPDFSYGYSHESYNLEGTINVTITQESPYAAGYSYTVGGVTETSKESTYSHKPNSVGSFEIRVYALGGNFDEEGVYYINSQSRGGKSHTITLLATPNESTVELGADGDLGWTAIAGAISYEVMISVNGGEFKPASDSVITKTFCQLDTDEIAGAATLTVRIRAIGNGTTIISSEVVEHTWTNL